MIIRNIYHGISRYKISTCFLGVPAAKGISRFCCLRKSAVLSCKDHAVKRFLSCASAHSIESYLIRVSCPFCIEHGVFRKGSICIYSVGIKHLGTLIPSYERISLFSGYGKILSESSVDINVLSIVRAATHRIEADYYLGLDRPFCVKSDIFIDQHTREIKFRSVYLVPGYKIIAFLSRSSRLCNLASEGHSLRSNSRAAVRFKGYGVAVDLPFYVYYRIGLYLRCKVKLSEHLSIRIPACKGVSAKSRCSRLCEHRAVAYLGRRARVAFYIGYVAYGRIESLPFCINNSR